LFSLSVTLRSNLHSRDGAKLKKVELYNAFQCLSTTVLPLSSLRCSTGSVINYPSAWVLSKPQGSSCTLPWMESFTKVSYYWIFDQFSLNTQFVLTFKPLNENVGGFHAKITIVACCQSDILWLAVLRWMTCLNQFVHSAKKRYHFP